MSFLLTLVTFGQSYKSNNEQVMKNIQLHHVSTQNYNQWIPLEIDSDFNYAAYLDDGMTCKSPGQKITFRGEEYICNQNQVLSNMQVVSLRSAMYNINTELKKFILIKKVASLEYRKINGILEIGKAQKINANTIHLIIASRPFKDQDETVQNPL